MGNAPIHEAADPDRARVQALVNKMHAACMNQRRIAQNPGHELSLIMTAAIVFAGTCYGTMMGAGGEELDDARQIELGNMLSSNFGAGISIALAKVACVAGESGMKQ